MGTLKSWFVDGQNGQVEVVEANDLRESLTLYEKLKAKFTESQQAGFWGRAAARQVIANRKLKDRNDALQARLDAIDNILSEENGEVSPDYFDKLWVALHPTRKGYEYVGLPVPEGIKE